MVKATNPLSSQRTNALRIKALCTILVKLTNHDMEQRLVQANIPLNVSTLVPLRILQNGPATVQELSELIIVAPATLIPVIDELEKKGLVTREVETIDRRKKLIRTTASGSALISKVFSINSKNKFVESISSMSQEEITKLISSLDKIITAVSGNDTLSKKIATNVCKQLPTPAGKHSKK